MPALQLNFGQHATGQSTTAAPQPPALALALCAPLAYEFLNGTSGSATYIDVQQTGADSWTANARAEAAGHSVKLQDHWTQVEPACMRLERTITVFVGIDTEQEKAAQGVKFHLSLQAESPDASAWRFFAPAVMWVGAGVFLYTTYSAIRLNRARSQRLRRMTEIRRRLG